MKENSIEEDIKSLEDFSNESVLYGSTVGMTLEKYKDLQLSTEHILSDYKRVLKENEELKEINEQLSENKLLQDIEIKKNFIPRQKIKDKIEYLDNQQKQWLEDRELKASDSEIIFARDFLQELLEGRK